MSETPAYTLNDKIVLYLNLQRKRFDRLLVDLGVHPVFGLGIVLVAFCAVSVLLCLKGETGAQILALGSLVATWPLSEHARVDRLKLLYCTQYRVVRVVENLLLSTPFVLALSIGQYFVLAGAALIGCLVLSLCRIPVPRSRAVRSPFTKHPFEFPSGLRKWWPLLLLQVAAYALGIAVGNLNISFFALLTIPLTVIGFYSQPEPLFYVWVNTTGPKGFLLNKGKTAFLLTVMTLLGPATLLCLMDNGFLWMSILAILLGGLLVSMSAMAKYAYYPSEVNIAGGLLITISIMLPPLIPFVLIYLFKRAMRNIDPLLP